MNSIRIALIGCGSLGGLHCDAVKQIGGAELYAFAEVFPKMAKEFCEKYGGCYFTDDVEKIFRDPKIDAIYICTRHDTHADFCIRAAQAGRYRCAVQPQFAGKRRPDPVLERRPAPEPPATQHAER